MHQSTAPWSTSIFRGFGSQIKWHTLQCLVNRPLSRCGSLPHGLKDQLELVYILSSVLSTPLISFLDEVNTMSSLTSCPKMSLENDKPKSVSYRESSPLWTRPTCYLGSLNQVGIDAKTQFFRHQIGCCILNQYPSKEMSIRWQSIPPSDRQRTKRLGLHHFLIRWKNRSQRISSWPIILYVPYWGLQRHYIVHQRTWGGG